MELILDKKMDPMKAANLWLIKNPNIKDQWLKGVLKREI
jgi:ABC-type proline/glycine betaine transport system substrate-binding protein